MNDGHRRAIAAAGGIPVLVSMAQDGSERAMEQAGAVLWILAMNDENKTGLSKLNYDVDNIPALLFLAGRYVDEIKVLVVQRLAELALNDEKRIAIAAAGGIPVLASLARDGSEQVKASAAGALRVLAMNTENKSAITAAGGVP